LDQEPDPVRCGVFAIGTAAEARHVNDRTC
jgi:hypothetical protein